MMASGGMTSSSILGKPVHYTDMEAEDYTFYQGMVYLLEHDLNEFGADLTFSIEVSTHTCKLQGCNYMWK